MTTTPVRDRDDVTVARRIVELVDDCTCTDDGPCPRAEMAASWPDPHPWHDLDEDQVGGVPA